MSRRWRRQGHSAQGLFRGLAPDVIGLPVAQGRVSVAATNAFVEWSKGGADASALRALEHDADDARKALLRVLRKALATPAVTSLRTSSRPLEAVADGFWYVVLSEV